MLRARDGEAGQGGELQVNGEREDMVEAAASDSSFEEVIPPARHLASSAAHRARGRIADSSDNSSVEESARGGRAKRSAPMQISAAATRPHTFFVAGLVTDVTLSTFTATLLCCFFFKKLGKGVSLSAFLYCKGLLKLNGIFTCESHVAGSWMFNKSSQSAKYNPSMNTYALAGTGVSRSTRAACPCRRHRPLAAYGSSPSC
eukprot:745685-Pleurochrysis_carterae.AAC.1